MVRYLKKVAAMQDFPLSKSGSQFILLESHLCEDQGVNPNKDIYKSIHL